MVSNELDAVVFPRDGQDGSAPPPRMVGNRAAGNGQLGIITVLIISAAAFQSAALGQPPSVSNAAGMSPPAGAPYPPPAYGMNVPMLDPNAAVQPFNAAQPSGGTEQVARGGYRCYLGPEAAQPSAATPPPKPEEKEQGEKSDTEEKKDDNEVKEQNSNFHSQITAVAQGDPGFPAQYSGPNSLNSVGERQSTVTADLFAGVRLWRGARSACRFHDVGGLRPDARRSASRIFPMATPTKPAPCFPTLPPRTSLFASLLASAANRRSCPTARFRLPASRTYRG